jgi:hypothetical protein
MKKLFSILTISILICLPSVVYAQTGDDPIIRIFNKYEEKDGVESVSISPALLRMMTRAGGANDQRTQDLISKITGLRILTISDNSSNRGRTNREAFTTELQTVVRNHFTEFMSVRNADERVELYVRNAPENQTNALLLITTASNSVTVIHLAGNIDKTLIEAVMSGEIGITNR